MGPDPNRQEAFEALYEKHRFMVLAYCARRLSGVDAADACSETFLIAWRRLDDIPPAPEDLPYLYGVARNVIRNQSRGRRRHERLAAKLESLGVVPPEEPPVVVEQESRETHVAAAVRRLPEKDREILMLHTWEDLPRDAVARLMGMSRSAIDQRIHRAHKRLARVLAAELGVASRPTTRNEGDAR